ncbi:zmpB, partial [Symbiodinium natans]
MVLLEALAERLQLQDLVAELQRDAPLGLRVQAGLILLIGVVLTVVVPWFNEQRGSPAEAPERKEDVLAPAKQPVAEEPSLEASAPAPAVGSTAGTKSSSLGAKGHLVEPIFTFDGCVFDGDRIVNIRERPHDFTQQLGGAISIAFTARWDAFQLRSRILDFGDGPAVDNIVIGNLEKGRTLLVEVYRGPSKKRLMMPGVLELGETHSYLLSISETGHTRMLRDGDQLGVQPQGFAPRALERRKLLIGGSNSAGDENFEGAICDLRIWRGVVSWSEAFPDQPGAPPPLAFPGQPAPAAPKEQEAAGQGQMRWDEEEVEEEDVPEPQFADADPEMEEAEEELPQPLAEAAEPPRHQEPPEAEEALEPRGPVEELDEEEDGWTVAKPTRKADRKSRAAAEAVKSSAPRSAKADRDYREHRAPVAPRAEKTSARAPPAKPAKPAKPAASAELAEPAEPAASAELAEPAEPAEPAEKPEKLEEKAEKAAEAAKPDKPDKPEKAEKPEQDAPKKRAAKMEAWADIPPEGTPPASPQPAELSAKPTTNYGATGEPESGMMPISEDANDNL